jgi:hypothetical protein
MIPSILSLGQPGNRAAKGIPVGQNDERIGRSGALALAWRT